MENAAIQSKITKLSGGIKIMKGLGFIIKEDTKQLYMPQSNIEKSTLEQSIKFLDSKLE